MDKQKDVLIQFRVSAALRDAWNEACDRNVQNGSELLRRYVKDYIVKSGVELPEE